MESLPEKQAAGVTWRAPDHYSRGSGVTNGGARGGVTAGAHRRRDERCRDRRGERRSHGRGQEQALLEGRTPALLEGGHRNYQRGRVPVLAQGRRLARPEGTPAGVANSTTSLNDVAQIRGVIMASSMILTMGNFLA